MKDGGEFNFQFIQINFYKPALSQVENLVENGISAAMFLAYFNEIEMW